MHLKQKIFTKKNYKNITKRLQKFTKKIQRNIAENITKKYYTKKFEHPMEKTFHFRKKKILKQKLRSRG